MRSFAIFLLTAASCLPTVAARAQTNSDPLAPPTDFGAGIIGQFDPNGGQLLGESVTFDSQFIAPQGDRPAILKITAHIAPNKHMYSLTQPPGGPNPTRIEVAPSADYRLLAPFRSQPAPHSRIETGPIWTGLEMQEQEGEVIWYAPVEITAGVDVNSLQIRGVIDGQVCETGGTCEPVRKDFTARLSPSTDGQSLPLDSATQSAIGNPKSEITSGSYQAEGSIVQITGRVEPATVRPGESAQLVITATVPAGWHVYAQSPRDNKNGSKPTLIAIERTGGLIPHAPTTDAPIKTDDSVPQFGTMRYHEGTVTWTTAINVPPNAPAGSYPIMGLLGYQACESRPDGGGTCELSHAVRFAGTVKVAAQPASGNAPLSFGPPVNYKEAATVAAVLADYLDHQSPSTPPVVAQRTNDERAIAVETEHAEVPAMRAVDVYDLERVQVDPETGSLSYFIALAFVGGLILNLMPCVLPVISLKVMSFVEQSGRSRSHALVLNLWYAAGIVVVFLLLGVLAATINLSWGGQFGSTAFNVTIAAVVFAMALSLLGVWEVPIPGFFGSGSVQSAAAQEGPLGAFLKGIVTTVLATPCTAPFMATAVAWAVTQPLATTLAVFASLGLGMASPYVLIGMYPELLRFLPKPGRWMETFKQVTGFVLLATVIFILSYIETAAVVPTVALLLGIGVACWLVARTPLTAELSDRLQTWGLAGAVLLLFVAVSFGWLYRDVMLPRFADLQVVRGASNAAWQPFSLERLKQVAVDSGQTVLVDFSADWCFNCKVLEQTVLHTEDIEQAISKSGAVTMYADYTDYPPEIEKTIRALRANGVPVIAVFPGNAPYQPLVFRGGYGKQGLIEALEKATGRRLGAGTNTIASAAVSQ